MSTDTNAPTIAQVFTEALAQEASRPTVASIAAQAHQELKTLAKLVTPVSTAYRNVRTPKEQALDYAQERLSAAQVAYATATPEQQAQLLRPLHEATRSALAVVRSNYRTNDNAEATQRLGLLSAQLDSAMGRAIGLYQ